MEVQLTKTIRDISQLEAALAQADSIVRINRDETARLGRNPRFNTTVTQGRHIAKVKGHGGGGSFTHRQRQPVRVPQGFWSKCPTTPTLADSGTTVLDDLTGLRPSSGSNRVWCVMIEADGHRYVAYTEESRSACEGIADWLWRVYDQSVNNPWGRSLAPAYKLALESAKFNTDVMGLERATHDFGARQLT